MTPPTPTAMSAMEMRDPRAEQQAAEDIRPHPVGAEPVQAGGRLQPVHRCDGMAGIRVGHQQRGEGGDDHEHQDDAEADGRQPVPPQALPQIRAHQRAAARGSMLACKASTSTFMSTYMAAIQRAAPMTAL